MVLSTENNYSTNIVSPVMLLVAPISGLTVKRTSDGGNGNHSVSLPIILIKSIKCFHLHIYAHCWSLFYDFTFDFLFA